MTNTPTTNERSAADRAERQAQVEEIMRKAEAETEQLRAAGWSQSDFARGLRELLMEDGAATPAPTADRR